jgi:hypothetical protein
LSHEDHVIVDDTIVKDGMVYNAIRRDAKIAAHVVVFPQVGEAYEETVILKSDNTMDELKQKIYVEDHPYVEPTPTPEDTVPVNPDTIPTPPTPPTPDEPGYPFQGGKVKAAYFTWAVDMNNRIHEAILIVTENTLVPIVDTDYQMVSGTRYVYNPSEVTVNDDIGLQLCFLQRRSGSCCFVFLQWRTLLELQWFAGMCHGRCLIGITRSQPEHYLNKYQSARPVEEVYI